MTATPGGSARRRGDLPDCYVCGTATDIAFVAHGYPVVACPSCGHRQAVVTSATSGDFLHHTYGDEYFVGGGAGYTDYLAEERLLVRHGRRYGRLLNRRLGRDGGVVLDIGSAAGFVLRGLADTGWYGLGVEPNATMAAHARSHVGVDVRSGTLDDVAAPAAGVPADVVTMIQVVAHLPDARRVLARALDHAAPDAHLLVETWDRNSLPARSLGRHWHEYSPPSVLHYYSLEGLVRVARQAGWRYAARGRPQKWLAARHAASVLAHAAGAPVVASAARVVPDVPVPYPALDLAWVLFSRS